MCTNYDAPQLERFRIDLNWPIPTFNYATAQYPGYLAPIQLIALESGEAVLREAMFGLVPFWSKDDTASRHTYILEIVMLHKTRKRWPQTQLPGTLEKAPLCLGADGRLL